MKYIKTSGWHNFNGSWRCAFNDFINDEMCNVLPEILIECDLHGYSIPGENYGKVSRILDIPFDRLRMNVKRPEKYEYLQGINFSKDPQDPDFFFEYEDYPIAQVLTVLDICSSRKYMYLSMTNFEFWDGATEQLLNEFGRPNIGGFMIAAGHCKVVDDKLRGALQL